jgi:hypothetical protein
MLVIKSPTGPGLQEAAALSDGRALRAGAETALA